MTTLAITATGAVPMVTAKQIIVYICSMYKSGMHKCIDMTLHCYIHLRTFTRPSTTTISWGCTTAFGGCTTAVGGCTTACGGCTTAVGGCTTACGGCTFH